MNFYRFVDKFLKREVKKWKRITPPVDYYFSILVPFIRLTSEGINQKKRRIHFEICHKMNQYPFTVTLNEEKKLFYLTGVNDDIKFIQTEPLVSSGSEKLSILLSRILHCYNLEKNVAKKEYSQTENEHRIYMDFMKTWMKYKHAKQLPHSITEELINTKRTVSTHLLRFVKQFRQNIHVRPINSFCIQMEFLRDYFKEIYPEIYQQLGLVGANFTIEFRFDIGFPQKFPLIRILNPQFDHTSGCVSRGGNFLKPAYSKFGEVKEKRFLSDTIQRVVSYLFNPDNGKIVFDLSDDYHFFDDMISALDYRRSKLYEQTVSGTVNNYAVNLNAYSPIFHFMGPGQDDKIQGMEYGNKIILPTSAVKKIFDGNRDVELPLFFELKTFSERVFCGVSEFTAQNGKVVVPIWIMKALKIEEGERIRVRCVKLPICRSIKFQPNEHSFFSVVKNFKTLLESQLKDYMSFQIGDNVKVKYGENTFNLYVLDLKPNDVVSVIGKSNQVVEVRVQVVPSLGFKPTKKSEESDDDDDDEKYFEDIETPVKVTGVKYVKCTNCNHSVNEISYRLHFRHCEKTYYKCAQCDGKIVKIVNKDKHNEEVHKPIKCEMCGEMILKADIDHHKNNLCENRMATCKFFGCPIIAKELVQHELRCGSKTEKCESCKKLIRMAEMDTHIVACVSGISTTKPVVTIPSRSPGLRFTPPVSQRYEDEHMRIALEKSRKEMMAKPKCCYCLQYFKTVTDVMDHIVKEHFDDPGKFKCPICKKLQDKLPLHLVSCHM